MRTTTKDALIIFAVTALLFCTCYGDRELMSYESRNGVFAREMLANGPTFFPTLYGEAYADYFGTQTLLVCAVSKMFGGITAQTLALPSALAAAAAVAFAYLIGATRSRVWGIAAAILLLGSYNFVAEARMPSLDHFITAITAACAWLAISQREAKGIGVAWRMALYPLLFLLGFALRGPIGTVIPVAATCACYAADFEWRKGIFEMFRSLRWPILAGVLGLLCLAASFSVLRYAAEAQGGAELVERAWNAQVSGRMGEKSGKPFYFYLVDGLPVYALSFPLAILACCVAYRKLLDKDDEDMRLMRAALLWTLFVICGLSIPTTKHLRYILAAIPAMALLGGFIFLPARKEKIFLELRRIFAKICAFAPLFGVFAAIPAYMLAERYNVDVPYAWLLPLCLLFLVMLVRHYLWDLRALGLAHSRSALLCLGIGVISFNLIKALAVDPALSHFELSRPFVMAAEAKRTQGDKLIFFKCGPDDLDVKYVFLMNKMLKPEFMGADENLADVPSDALLVAKKKDFERTDKTALEPFEVVAEGKLGRKDCVAFRRATAK